MIAVTSELRAKAGRERELERITTALAEQVREGEPGCLGYWPTRSRHDPRVFLLLAHFRDDAALNAHSHAEHFKQAFTALMRCVEQPPRVAIFEGLGPDANARAARDAG